MKIKKLARIKLNSWPNEICVFYIWFSVISKNHKIIDHGYNKSYTLFM